MHGGSIVEGDGQSKQQQQQDNKQTSLPSSLSTPSSQIIEITDIQSRE